MAHSTGTSWSVSYRAFQTLKRKQRVSNRNISVAIFNNCTPAAMLRQTAAALPRAHQPYNCRQRGWQSGGHLQRIVQVRVGDAPPEWTLDQIAGLVFGGFLLITVTLALQVDKVVAKAQRRELGLCEHCGGINDPHLCKTGKCPSLKQ